MCVALVASVLADEVPEAQKVVLPALAYPYADHHPVPGPMQYKYVPKEVEIESRAFGFSDECYSYCVDQTCGDRPTKKCMNSCIQGCA